MTDTLTCVTNIMDDIPSCTVRDEHEDHCDGWEYRYARGPHEWTEVATGRPCRGCVPRPAEHGMLCTACWRSLEGALRAAPPLVDLLSSYDRLVQQKGGGGSTEPTVPLAPTKLALDEIESYEGSRRGRPAEVWVANEAGAIDAVRFTRAVRAAKASFPDRESPTDVPRERCPECQMLALQIVPPTLVGDPIRVACGNPTCRYEREQDVREALPKTHLVAAVLVGNDTGRAYLARAAAEGRRVTTICGHEWLPIVEKGVSYRACDECVTLARRVTDGI